MRSLLELASKARSSSTPLTMRGPCWQLDSVLAFVRATASVAASTPFDIGKALRIDARSPLGVQVKHRSTGDMSVELRGTDISTRFSLEAGEHGIRACEQQATRARAELVATIPERYCGVSVRTQGGTISLPGLTEAYLDISTDGDGAVHVGKIKANTVALNTQRGSITGSITATDIKVESSNGDISLKRTAGKTAHLTTGGGGIALDVLQVASGHLHSGGGSITIGQVTPYAGEHEEGSCAQAVQVLSGGGSISIRGLDGSLSIDSAGGEVVLQCTQNLRHAIVRSNGGDVSVFTQPDTRIQLHAAGGKGVEIQADCAISGPHSQQTPTMVQGCLEVQGGSSAVAETQNSTDGSSSEDERTSNVTGSTRGERAEPSLARSDAEQPTLIVVAGDGGVRLLVRSWRESMLQRLSKTRAVA